MQTEVRDHADEHHDERRDREQSEVVRRESPRKNTATRKAEQRDEHLPARHEPQAAPGAFVDVGGLDHAAIITRISLTVEIALGATSDRWPCSCRRRLRWPSRSNERSI